MDFGRRLSPQEVADLMRESGFPVIGDDVAWIAKRGVVLDFPLSDSEVESADLSNELDDESDEDYLSNDSRPESLLYLLGCCPPVVMIMTEHVSDLPTERKRRRLGVVSPGHLARFTRKLIRRIRVRPLRVYR